ncbi:GATS protein-like 3 [Rhizopus azygosporus]|uniref:GATS protein-like 3 n=1 Tax=Rhizopus azygosporus TaxID=86630 RepID=A0A367JMF2_RHIAZ|nr:GATS protein-like 3 [Rhizopus azygosporus]
MISILPCKVKLLHFPRSHLHHVTHAIVKACFFQDMNDLNYFFSFTENAFEISIVANKQVIDQDFIPPLTMTQCHDMKYSNDIYRVLQVDDEGGQGASGKRISDISEPLAQGKFSIFYMSTYQTDYVLVKERRLRQAIELLGQLGYQFDQDSLESYLGDSPPSSSHTSQEDLKEEDFEKSVLTDELQCVGLNPHLRSEWAMTVLKILSYPELITPDGDSRRFFSYTASNEGISLIANQAILDLFSEADIFQDEESPRYRVIQVNLAGSNLDRCGIVWSISRPLAAHMNLLYLSTFKSANVLVSSDDLPRAEEILANDLKKGMMAEVILEPE